MRIPNPYPVGEAKFDRLITSSRMGSGRVWRTDISEIM